MTRRRLNPWLAVALAALLGLVAWLLLLWPLLTLTGVLR